MAITVVIDLARGLAVKAPLPAVFAVLADVRGAARDFPRVAAITGLGDGVYRWELEKVRVGQAAFQAVYASRYRVDAAAGCVAWVPVAGHGNAAVGGAWRAQARAGGTALRFNVEARIEVPLPALMRPVVVPVARREFEQLVEAYLDSLAARFGGRLDDGGAGA